MTNRIHVGYREPLKDGDTKEKTVGCRATNPDNCRFNGTEYCAFCRGDRMCLNPPKTWPKQFEILENEDKKE